jgi:hypothetical protein
MNYTDTLYIIAALHKIGMDLRIVCGAAGPETSNPVPEFLSFHVLLHELPAGARRKDHPGSSWIIKIKCGNLIQ